MFSLASLFFFHCFLQTTQSSEKIVSPLSFLSLSVFAKTLPFSSSPCSLFFCAFFCWCQLSLFASLLARILVAVVIDVVLDIFPFVSPEVIWGFSKGTQTKNEKKKLKYVCLFVSRFLLPRQK